MPTLVVDVGHSIYLSIRHHRFHRKQPFCLIWQVISPWMMTSWRNNSVKVNFTFKQIRIIVVPRAGKINWPWSRSRSKQRSRHGANWKDFFQGSFMTNINVISLILQKIWALLKFLWQTEGRTNKPIDGRTNGF